MISTQVIPKTQDSQKQQGQCRRQVQVKKNPVRIKAQITQPQQRHWQGQQCWSQRGHAFELHPQGQSNTQGNRQKRLPATRQFTQLTLVQGVVQHGGQRIHPGLHAGKWRGVNIVQTGRGGTHDHHLAGKRGQRGQRLAAFRLCKHIGKRNMRVGTSLAAPGNQLVF